MKCPKCSYVSYDYLDACRKCHIDLVKFKQKFNLMVLQPGDLDLGEMVDVDAESVAYRDGFRSAETPSDTPYGGSHMTNGLGRKVSKTKSQRGAAGLDNIPADMEVDIQFDTVNPTISTEPGELTRTFYIPEELAKQTFKRNLPARKTEMDEKPAEPKSDIQSDTGNLTTSTGPGGLTKTFYMGLDEIPAEPKSDIRSAPDNPAPLAENMPALPDDTVSQTNPVASVQDAQYFPGNTLDMSVGKLDDCFDNFDDIQLDTTEIDHNIDLAFNLPADEPGPAVTDDAPSRSAKRNLGPETGRMRTPDVKEDGGER
jgi:hypothetical protein